MLHFDANAPVVPARLAATLLLLRDGDQGLEVFVMRRHERSGFLGGAVVFPGGKVESYDWLESPMSELSRPPFLNSRQFGEPREVLACAIAAVRESLEEAGIFALGGLPSPTDSEIRTLRETLVAAPDTFLELVQGRGFRLDLSDIHAFARWVTPEAEARRFDTRFFVMCAPENQTGSQDGHESVDAYWATPTFLLTSFEHSSIQLAPPTHRCLEILAQAPNVQAALALADSACLDPICPVFRQGQPEGAVPDVLLLPGHPDHPVLERRVSGTDAYYRDGARWLPLLARTN
jgi:8-oxo-dGTP pyrophosphatase MutT (NUDIX family)